MKRNIWILIIVLGVLGLATFFVLRQPGETSSSGTTGEMLVQYDSAAVDRIEIVSATGAVTLAIDAGRWMILVPISYRADNAAVTRAVGMGNRIALKTVISSNPQKQQLFQVDSSGTLVRVYEHGRERASFRIGKPGTSFTETYVRREGSNDVYLADGLLTYTFQKPVKDWRDKSVFRTDQEKVRSVKFQFRDTTFTLGLRDTLWQVDQESASQTAVKSFLGAVADIQADEFIDSVVTAPPPPVAAIEIDGTQIRFHAAKGQGTYLVRTSNSPQWFELQGWRASQILKRKKDFLQY